MIKPEVMLFEECHSNILRDRSFQKHSYNNKHDSEDGKLAHSSFEECKNVKICDDITQTVHIPCDNVLCNLSGVESATTESDQNSDIATDHLSLTPFFDLTPNSLDREISMRVRVSVCKLQEAQIDEFETVKNCSLTTDSAFQNEPYRESTKSIATSNKQSSKNLSNSDSTESVCSKRKVSRKRRPCSYSGTEELVEEEAVGNIPRKSETTKRISSPVKSLRRSSRLSGLRKRELEIHVKVDAIPEESCNSTVADTDAKRYLGNVNKRRGRNGTATADSSESEDKVLEVSGNLSDTSSKTNTDVTKCVYLLFSGIESSVYTSTLKKLGACETSDATLADYVITDEIRRTLKILYSRARGIPVISVDWLKACKKCRKGSNPGMFMKE
ncbi:unnamed protein product [Trichobilharzia szidati]|nr:unnamed protein product [Trichobilharzia szidati]